MFKETNGKKPNSGEERKWPFVRVLVEGVMKVVRELGRTDNLERIVDDTDRRPLIVRMVCEKHTPQVLYVVKKEETSVESGKEKGS